MSTTTAVRPFAPATHAPETVGVLTLSSLVTPAPLRAPATLIDFTGVAAAVRSEVAADAERGRRPGLRRS